MKIQKSNNPLAVGALLCTLALIVGRTIWLVTRGDGSAQMVSAAVTPAAAVSPQPQNAVPDAAPRPVPASPTAPPAQHSARNPFALRHAASAKSAAMRQAPPPAPSHPAGKDAVPEVRPLPVGPLPVPSRPAGPPQARTAALAPPAPAPDPLQNIRLTAVVDGTRRMAVLQTTDPQPLIVHEGDTVQGLRVTAIHDTEVVFTREGKSWTLPMQTADTPITVTPAEAPPVTAQEKNVDATQ